MQQSNKPLPEIFHLLMEADTRLCSGGVCLSMTRDPVSAHGYSLRTPWGEFEANSFVDLMRNASEGLDAALEARMHADFLK